MDKFRMIAYTNYGVVRIVTENKYLGKSLHCRICKRNVDYLNLDTPNSPTVSEILDNETHLGDDIIWILWTLRMTVGDIQWKINGKLLLNIS